LPNAAPIRKFKQAPRTQLRRCRDFYCLRNKIDLFLQKKVGRATILDFLPQLFQGNSYFLFLLASRWIRRVCSSGVRRRPY